MKKYSIIPILLLLLGAGCNPVEKLNTNSIESDTVVTTRLENKQEPQDAVFMLQVGITGGMGSAKVLIESDETSFLGPLYLRESDVERVLDAGGGLPACYVDPQILVSANVTVVEKTDTNYSLPVPEETMYYEVQVNVIDEVSIQYGKCN